MSKQAIRQDYLDEIIWEQVIRLLENPDLIRHEIGQRIKKIQNSNPTKKRKDVLDKEIRQQRKRE